VEWNRNKKKLIIFRIHCAIIKALHSLTYGDTPKGWVGLEPLKDKLKLFDDRLAAFFVTTAVVFPSEPTWITTGENNLKLNSDTLKEDTLSTTLNKGKWIYKNDPVDSLPANI